VIFSDIARALGQLPDPAFRRVFWRALGLTVLMLGALATAIFALAGWLTPAEVAVPWLGPVGWLDELFSVTALLLTLALSVFLMIPVASAFTGVMLEEIADAVEARHYPRLPPAAEAGIYQNIRESVNFLGVMIAANILAVILYLPAGPFAPIIFYALNGYLLAREYFQMTAMRRMDRREAHRLRRRHRGQVWALGVAMALPLTVPVLNLFIPLVGAAAFTHLFHRLQPRARPAGFPMADR